MIERWKRAYRRGERPVLFRGTGFNSASYVYKGYPAKRKVTSTWLGSVERVKRANKNLCAKKGEKRGKRIRRRGRTTLKTYHYPTFLLWNSRGAFMNTLPGPRRFKICYACVYVFPFQSVPSGLDSSWSTETLATDVLRSMLLGFALEAIRSFFRASLCIASQHIVVYILSFPFFTHISVSMSFQAVSCISLIILAI